MKRRFKVEFAWIHVFGVPFPVIRIEYSCEQTDSQSPKTPGQEKD